MSEAPETMTNQEFFDTYDVKVTPKLLTRTYIDYPFLREMRDRSRKKFQRIRENK